MRRKESRRLGLEHPGRTKQQGPPPPGLEHPGTSGGQTPRTGTSRTQQAAGATAPRTGAAATRRVGSIGEMWPANPARGGISGRSPHPPGWRVQGNLAARGERKKGRRPRWCSEGVMSGSNAKDNATEMH